MFKFFIFFNTYIFNQFQVFLVEVKVKLSFSSSSSLILYHKIIRIVDHKLVIIQIIVWPGPVHRRRPGPGAGTRSPSPS